MKDILVSYLQSDVTGCSYYRLVQIRNELNNRGYIKCYDAPHNYSPLSDIVVWQRYDALEVLYNFDKSKINIYEIDDNIWELPDYLGQTKDYYIQREEDIKDFINMCNYVTTTTDYLANEIAKHTGFPREKIIVIPNFVNTRLLQYGKKSMDGKVRIAWTMDTRRKDFDIEPAKKALLSILKKYPDKVELILFGDMPICFKEIKNVRIIPFNKNIEDYYKTLTLHPIDIGICPAKKTIFNNSKSNLKILEFGAIGVPVVVSPIEPYKKFADDFPHIKIATTEKEWKHLLTEYIESSVYRIQEGFDLHSFVNANYDLVNNGVPMYYNFYKDLIEKHKIKHIDNDKYIDFLNKKILYCVSSKDRNNLPNIKMNVGRYSMTFDIAVLLAENTGAYGLDTIYNDMVKNNPDYDYYIFAHDDIEIFDEHWLYKIITGLEKYDVVGVAGGRFFDPMHGMWAPMLSGLFSSGSVAHSSEGRYAFTNYGLQGDAVTLDGCFMAMKANVAKEIKWKAFSKFHFYDIAFCLDAIKAGYKLGVIPIGIKHKSPGNYNGDWGKALAEFRQVYGYKPYRYSDEKTAFNVYIGNDDANAQNHMLRTLSKQSIIVEPLPYVENPVKPYVYIDRSIHFHPFAFGILNELVKLDKYGKIQFSVGSHIYTLRINDRERKYIVHTSLGLDYYEEFNYVGRY